MENSVDLIKIWKIIKRNFNLIIILPIVGLIIGLLCSLILVKPMFQASTQVIVNEKKAIPQCRLNRFKVIFNW